MKNKILTPQISTLIAELKIIKIGNKKMTISVFNQIQEKSCIEGYYEIGYPVWGWVLRDNYKWIIFQIGKELRKMRMPVKFPCRRDGLNIMQIELLRSVIPDDKKEIEIYNLMVEKLQKTQQLFIAV
jgi:hypothetical protein